MSGPVSRLRHRLRPGRDENGFDRRLLLPMMAGAALNPVNSSIISVSLVPIGAAFGAPPAQTAWLISALYLATAIGQPVVGRLIDLFGPRRLFLAGTALTGIAGVAGMLAPDLGVLIAARVLLGFGTCAGYPAAMYLIRSEARRTGQDSPAGVLTALAVTTQTIAVVGPSLGGLLIGLGGWRATLAVNVPLAVAGLYLGARRIPATPAALRDDDRRPVAALDLPGMGLFAVTLVSLLLFLMNPGGGNWYLLILAAAAGAGFAWCELRARQPFIDVRVLGGNLPLLATYGRALLGYVVTYAFLYGYTQWTEEGRGLPASEAGLVQLPLFATAIIVSAITGRRRAVRGKLLLGAAGQIIACAMLFFLNDHSPVWTLVAVVIVLGVPQGLNSLALQNAVYHQADADRMGSSAGLLRTFGYLGAIIASAANGAFFGQRADTGGLHHLGVFMLVVSVLFLVVTVADRSLRRIGPETDVPAEPPAGDPDLRAAARQDHPRHRGSTVTNPALLVMDVQNAIVDRISDVDPAYTTRLATAVAAARSTGVPVVHVVVGFRSGHPEAKSSPLFNALPEGVFTEGDPGAAIHPDVAPGPGECVVTKKRVSAFTGSDLDLVLRGAGVDHLVLTGLSTSGVVLSTLRQAADLDYRLTVLADGCADPDPEVHRVLTEKVFPHEGTTVTTVAAWEADLA